MSTPRTTIRTSTGAYTGALLKFMWQSRKSLPEAERKGLQQVLYAFFASRVESLLKELLRSRFLSISALGNHTQDLEAKQFRTDADVTYSLSGISGSLRSLCQSRLKKLEKASMRELQSTYNVVFDPSLSERLGSNLNCELDALSSLRNCFAHSGNLSITYDNNQPHSSDIGQPQLSEIVLVLKKAGLCQLGHIDRNNYKDAWAHIYSDAVLLYFHSSAQRIQRKIIEGEGIFPDDALLYMHLVPELES